MKNIITLLLLAGSIHTAFAQPDDFKPVYSLADMNLRGNIKEIKEKTFETDKRRNATDGASTNTVYVFDRNKKLRIRQRLVTLGSGSGTVYTDRYATRDGIVHTLRHTQESVYVSFVSGNESKTMQAQGAQYYKHSPAQVVIKDSASRAVVRTHAIKDGRIIADTTFTKPDLEYTVKTFQYNEQGQLVKMTLENLEVIREPDAENTELIKTLSKFYYLFEYNKQGYIETMKCYDKNDKLDYVTGYEYTYDANGNWTECFMSEETKTGKKEKIYEKATRVYEMY